MTAVTREAALAAFLEWHAEAGVGDLPGPEPRDLFAEASAPLVPLPAPKAAPPAAPRASRPAAGAAPDEAARSARALAEGARTLEELEAALREFEGCTLRTTASRLAFADGHPGARVVLVGEAPGAEEDRVGKPFMGRSGQLLDRMLGAIGLDRGPGRTGVYLCNVVPWRPPGNRTPTPQEAAICRPFLERQIELVGPEFLVLLGGPAMQSLLGIKEGILRSRGTWRSYPMNGRDIPALPTLHPAYLLRQPAQKRLAWRDFRSLRDALDPPGTG